MELNKTKRTKTKTKMSIRIRHSFEWIELMIAEEESTFYFGMCCTFNEKKNGLMFIYYKCKWPHSKRSNAYKHGLMLWHVVIVAVAA